MSDEPQSVDPAYISSALDRLTTEVASLRDEMGVLTPIAIRKVLAALFFGVLANAAPSYAQYPDQGSTARPPCSYFTNKQIIGTTMTDQLFPAAHMLTVTERWEIRGECFGRGMADWGFAGNVRDPGEKPHINSARFRVAPGMDEKMQVMFDDYKP